MWPVAGPDLKKSLSEFLRDRLKISSRMMADMGSISIKKVFAGPRSKIQNEIVAVFASSEVRDAIRRGARELAGDPDAGIRLEIPGHLQTSLKALEAVSFGLKQPKMRRNVKFDDAELDLVLDFSLDPDGGAPWRKIRPAQAITAKAKLGKSGAGEVNDDELDTMLSAGGSGNGGEKNK